MAKMIQIRDVPEEVHRTLKVRAASSGMSLSDYIKRDLEQSAGRPTLEEIDERVAARGQSKLATRTVLDALDKARGR